MKKLISMLLALMMVLSLVACGSSSGAKDVDIAAMAKKLTSDVSFDNALSEESEDILRIYFDIPSDASIVGYMSEGTSKEAVVCIKCAKGDQVKDVQNVVKAYLDECKTEASRYSPEEVERVEKAITQVSGNVVVLCITSDTDTAKGIIKEYVG